MSTIYQREKFPYLFVALVGIFIWSLNNLIENGKNSPIIEYKVQKKGREKGEKYIQINLKNLSSSHRLDDMEFSIWNMEPSIDPKIDTFISGKIRANPPAYQNFGIEKSDITGPEISFKIGELQPSYAFKINIKYSGKMKPLLILKNSNRETIRLVEANPLTWMLKNQVEINLIFLLISILFVIVYFRFLKNNPI